MRFPRVLKGPVASVLATLLAVALLARAETTRCIYDPQDPLVEVQQCR